MIKITSSYPTLFENVHKYVDYLNHLLNEQLQSMIFLETIDKGIIYIYRNYPGFEGLNQPLTSVERKNLPSYSAKGEEFFLKNILSPTTFPASGVWMYYEYIGTFPEQAQRVLQDYFLFVS